MPLKGNIGLQYVVADQQSTGYQTFTNNAVGNLIVGGDKYGELLPSLNLNLGIPWDVYVRFAAARQMARPRLDDLRSNFDVQNTNSGQQCGQFAGPTWCGTAGNPELRPWLANAYDLSVEKYFTTEAGNKGYASAAYFFKDLETYIYKARIPYDFSGLPLPPRPTNLDPLVQYPTGTAGYLEQPFNGEGGVLKGLELSMSVPLDVLWGGLNGFGIQASYSDTKSSISPNGPGTSEPLPGLSKYVSNVTAYYERYGFSLRVSQRSHSAFRAETRGGSTPGADLQYIDIQGEKVQDAQVNYNFQPGSMLEGLSLYLQMSNIGDEPFRTADGGDPELRPIQFFEYGKTTLLGFSYKFK
jgi:iron complex outermembrane receptor protein